MTNRFLPLLSALILSSSLSSSIVPAAQAQTPAAAARTVEITSGDDMKYSVTSIPAKRGETLRIVLKATGAMPKIAMSHNVVVLKPGTDQMAFVNAGASARATNYIAPAMNAQVIAHTPLAGNGETVEITFKVPATAGSYPYVCTFPGHFISGMKGTLVVK
jgi:azurin